MEKRTIETALNKKLTESKIDSDNLNLNPFLDNLIDDTRYNSVYVFSCILFPNTEELSAYEIAKVLQLYVLQVFCDRGK